MASFSRVPFANNLFRRIILPRYKRLQAIPSCICRSNRTLSSIAGLRIAPDGIPELDLDQNGILLESTPAMSSRTRILTLNRPASLNSLNLEMALRLFHRIQRLNRLSDVDCVVIQGKGRSFCSGGDVRELYEHIKKGDIKFAEDRFRTVYQFYWWLRSSVNLTLISILDGIAMGGGMGLAAGSRYRIATENSAVAMPEPAIGLHPDAGMNYWGSRLKGEFGLYLATGVRIGGRECVEQGIATHFIQSQHIPELLERLGSINSKQRDMSIKRILGEYSDFSKDGHEEERKKKAMDIERCFKEGSATEILAKIQKEKKFQDAAAAMKYASPLSMAIAVESLRRGKILSLKECIKLDYRLSVRLIRDGDFLKEYVQL